MKFISAKFTESGIIISLFDINSILKQEFGWLLLFFGWLEKKKNQVSFVTDSNIFPISVLDFHSLSNFRLLSSK